MPDIQSAIDHIKSAIDVDLWAADMAKRALKKQIPMKWVYDRPGHWKCPTCGVMMGRDVFFRNYCYNCGQRCEGVTATDELIVQLRKKAQMFNAEPLWLLLKDAADRLEEYKNREEPNDAGR